MASVSLWNTTKSMINAATNPKILHNQIFHMHDSWDLDTVKRKHAWILLAECSIPKQLVHQKWIDNYMERKKKKFILPFLPAALCFTVGNWGIETSTGHAWLKLSLLLLFFLAVVPVGAAHLCHNKSTWDQPSPYGHYKGINLRGHPDLWTLWRLDTVQKAQTTSHCPADHQCMSKNRHWPQTTTQCAIDQFTLLEKYRVMSDYDGFMKILGKN